MKKTEWLSAGEAAKILGVTPRHIWHLARAGAIKSMVLGPRTRIYWRASVEGFERQRPGPKPKLTKK